MQNLHMYKNFYKPRLYNCNQVKLMLSRNFRNVFMLVALTLGCSLFTLP